MNFNEETTRINAVMAYVKVPPNLAFGRS